MITAVVVLPVTPAFGDTACADVWLERENAGDWYVLGPNNCRETGWDREAHLWDGHRSEDMPDGWVCGYGLDLWVTLPPGII